MLAAFRSVPDPLQRQVLVRLGLGAAFLVMSLALVLWIGDLLVWLPGIFAAVFFCVSGAGLFRRAVLGRYVVVRGVCSEVGRTTVKHRQKSILLEAEGHMIRVALHGRGKRITVGMPIQVYIAENTPVYEKDGVLTLYSYLVIERMDKGG